MSGFPGAERRLGAIEASKVEHVFFFDFVFFGRLEKQNPNWWLQISIYLYIYIFGSVARNDLFETGHRKLFHMWETFYFTFGKTLFNKIARICFSEGPPKKQNQQKTCARFQVIAKHNQMFQVHENLQKANRQCSNAKYSAQQMKGVVWICFSENPQKANPYIQCAGCWVYLCISPDKFPGAGRKRAKRRTETRTACRAETRRKTKRSETQVKRTKVNRAGRIHLGHWPLGSQRVYHLGLRLVAELPCVETAMVGKWKTKLRKHIIGRRNNNDIYTHQNCPKSEPPHSRVPGTIVDVWLFILIATKGFLGGEVVVEAAVGLRLAYSLALEKVVWPIFHIHHPPWSDFAQRDS